MTVADGPRPTSICDSMIDPEASAFGLAFNSSTSALEEKCSLAGRWIALVLDGGHGTVMVSPPQSSGGMPRSCIWPFTRSRLAPLTSILLMATMSVTWHSARAEPSSVCGMKPSSAATTARRMSVNPGAAGAHLVEERRGRACRGR